MHHKRKRSRRQVCCTMCTKFTWLGNCKDRKPIRDQANEQRKLQES